MKKKFLCILLSTTLLLTGCGSTSKKDTSSFDLKETTDKYGQTVYDTGTETEWTSAEKFPVYLKYGKKYIKFKSIEGYYDYNDEDYTYGLYMLLTIDRKNLSKKDIHFLSDSDEDDLNASIEIGEKEDTKDDDRLKATYIGSKYDKDKWTMYYYFEDSFRNKPKTFFTDISFYVNKPDTDETNHCSLFNYKLTNSDFKELDAIRGSELNECMYDELERIYNIAND